MPLTTPRRGNHYDVLGDTPDAPAMSLRLATDLDDAPAFNIGLLSARPTSGRFVGDIYWATDDLTMGLNGTPSSWNGASWQIFSAASNPANAVAGLRTLGTAAGAALPGNDASVTNARTPIAHAASHLQGGSDKIHGIVPLGGVIDYYGAGDPADTDWLMPNGRALNSAADPTLTPLWTEIGTAHGGTGANNFFMPDERGRVTVMAGTAVPAVPGGTNHVIAVKGGEETHVLVKAELPNVSTNGESGTHNHFLGPTASSTPGEAWLTTIQNLQLGGTAITLLDPTQHTSVTDVNAQDHTHALGGTDTPHNNMPPFITCNRLMRVR